MAGDPRWRNSKQRQKDRRYWERRGDPCAICGQPIDYSVPFYFTGPDGKRHVNMDAFVIDEILPVSRGGNPYDRRNQQPAHVRCNLAKGDRVEGDEPAPAQGGLACLFPW